MNKKNIFYSLFFLMIIFTSVNNVLAMEEANSQLLDVITTAIESGKGASVSVSGGSYSRTRDGVENTQGPSVTIRRPDGTSMSYQEWQRLQSLETTPYQKNKTASALILALSNMNSLASTIGATILYELFSGKKLIHKLPLLPDNAKHRLANALRGGLYASIVNSLLGNRNIWPFAKEVAVSTENPRIQELLGKPLNGWKVIAIYLLVDLGSRYGWNTIKKLTSKPVKDPQTKTSQEKKESAKVAAILGWGVKTFLTGLIAHTIP